MTEQATRLLPDAPFPFPFTTLPRYSLRILNRTHLRIELDETRHVAGGVIRGHLVLTSTEARRCETLEVSFRWGLGTTAPMEPDEAVHVWSGECPAGETITQSFELKLPPAPASYSGSLFEVVCWIEARAHITGTKDPVVQQVIEVAPRTEAEPPWNLLYHESSAAVHSSEDLLAEALPGHTPVAVRIPAGPALQAGCLAVLLAPVIIILLLLAFGLYELVSAGALLEAAGLAVLAVVLLVIAFRKAGDLGLGNRMTKRRLGEVELHLPQRLIRSGQEVPVRITLRPSKRITISRITARLVAEEQREYPSETRSNKIRTHTILEQELELSSSRELPAGHPTVMSGVMTVPAGPPSFAVARNQLSWWLDIRIEIREGADWESRHLMLMYP